MNRIDKLLLCFIVALLIFLAACLIHSYANEKVCQSKGGVVVSGSFYTQCVKIEIIPL